MVWAMTVPHIPSHDGNQRVQKKLWEEWGRGRAARGEGGPSSELMFRDSARSEAVRAKQPQGWYRTPTSQPFLPDFRDLAP